jgi:glyoxylase-like metal-dependent hydrolase (beta-lactamase superfamily II)
LFDRLGIPLDQAGRVVMVGNRLERDVLGARPVRRVVCTHYHPDHVGLAGWLVDRWGSELWCTEREWLYARVYSLETRAAAEAAAARFYRGAGVSDDAMAPLLERASSYKELVAPVPPTYRRVRDGAELRVGGATWRALVGRGHSPEHLCLYAPERGLLVSGDQVLPTISPNVSVAPSEPDADPVAEFLDTLAKLRAVPDHVLALPSHGRPFAGVRRRADELVAHHRQRLEDVLAACAEPRTGWEVALHMFRRELDPHQMTFAVGEGIAHLNHLVAKGLVRRERTPGAPDRYTREER